MVLCHGAVEIIKLLTYYVCSRGIALAHLNGPIYAVGGLDDTACFSIVERYDAESNCWTTVQSMNSARGGVAVTAFRVCLSVCLSVCWFAIAQL